MNLGKTGEIIGRFAQWPRLAESGLIAILFALINGLTIVGVGGRHSRNETVGFVVPTIDRDLLHPAGTSLTAGMEPNSAAPGSR